MRDIKCGNEEEEEDVADCNCDDELDKEEEEDANATIVGVQVARSQPNDRDSERVCMQEDPIPSDSLCRLLLWW
jgi:hypothetical protein